jgi:hypothetical protein
VLLYRALGIVFFLFLGATAVVSQVPSVLLMARGQEADGRLADLRSDVVKVRHFPLTRHRVRYQFAVEGAPREDTQEVDPLTFRGLKSGMTVRVRYVPSRPAVSEFREGRAWLFAVLDLLLLLGAAAGTVHFARRFRVEVQKVFQGAGGAAWPVVNQVAAPVLLGLLVAVMLGAYVVDRFASVIR